MRYTKRSRISGTHKCFLKRLGGPFRVKGLCSEWRSGTQNLSRHLCWSLSKGRNPMLPRPSEINLHAPTLISEFTLNKYSTFFSFLKRTNPNPRGSSQTLGIVISTITLKKVNYSLKSLAVQSFSRLFTKTDGRPFNHRSLEED